MPRVTHQHVLRAHVPVHDVQELAIIAHGGVCRVQSGRNRGHQIDGGGRVEIELRRIERTPNRAQRATVDELHHQVVEIALVSQLLDVHHIRMGDA